MRAPDPVARLGLIAGCGSLPLEAATCLRESGVVVVALGFDGLTDPALAERVDGIRWLPFGRLEAAEGALRGLAVERILMVGAVPKQALFGGGVRLEPDEAAKALLASLAHWRDGALFAALAGWFERRGFAIARQDEALPGLLARAGGLSHRAPDAGEAADLAVGRRALAALGDLEVGQCVVVKQGVVVAVEAVEGTDATIRRGGALAGPGTTVVKGARPGQDRRFDLPAIGPDTIAAMVEAKAACLAVEADATLVLDRAGLRVAADRAGIAVTAFSPDRIGS